MNPVVQRAIKASREWRRLEIIEAAEVTADVLGDLKKHCHDSLALPAESTTDGIATEEFWSHHDQDEPGMDWSVRCILPEGEAE